MEFALLFTHISFFLLSLNDRNNDYKKYFEISCFYLILFCVSIEYFFTIFEVLISIFMLLYNCCNKNNEPSENTKKSINSIKILKNSVNNQNNKHSKNNHSKARSLKKGQNQAIILIKKNPRLQEEETKEGSNHFPKNSNFSTYLPNEKFKEQNYNYDQINNIPKKLAGMNNSLTNSKNQINSNLNQINNRSSSQMNTNFIGYYVNNQKKANYINYNFVKNDYTGKCILGNNTVNNFQVYNPHENPNAILLPGQIRSNNNSTTQVIGIDDHHNLGKIIKNDSTKNFEVETKPGKNYYSALFKILK